MKRINNTKIKGRQLLAQRAALMGKNFADSANTRTMVTQVKKPTTRFEKDMNEFYATFDVTGYFKQKNITCVLLLRQIIPNNANVNATLEDIRK